MKQCVTCHEWKDESEFNWRWKALGIRHPTCRECHKTFRRNWYQGDAHERHLQNVKERKHEARNFAREYVYEYLKTHPCTQCGESDPVVLEFHHVEKKDMDVAAMVAGGYSIERIQSELEKCVVLCANCHRKVTHTERGWFRGRK
jgi:hypothetical protein